MSRIEKNYLGEREIKTDVKWHDWQNLAAGLVGTVTMTLPVGIVVGAATYGIRRHMDLNEPPSNLLSEQSVQYDGKLVNSPSQEISR